MRNFKSSCSLLLWLCFTLFVCFAQAQTPTVSSLQATGTGIKWYDAPTGGTQYTGTEALVHGQTYYASQTVNGMESTARLAVTANLVTVSDPAAGTHTPSQTEIVWNWNTVSGATGYKWGTTNVYADATDMGTALTKTETGLTCNTSYSRYVWAYNALGCISASATLTQSTASCVFTCGSSITKDHLVTGGVAPVDKTVTYGTVNGIAGEPLKCWITRNLGAAQQATSVDDATEASAGWYWQFNRKQGYKHDGSVLTPAWTITSIDEISEWSTANDPCALELGTGWRIPTSSEWTNVDASGNWTDWNGPWNSGLKLHAAGCLYGGNGALINQGGNGYYWTSTQFSSTLGWDLYINSSTSYMHKNDKAYGFSARCVRDFSCASTLTISHVAGVVAPVSKTVDYGTVNGIAGEPSKCWITRNLGASQQATSVDDATEASAGWYWQFNRKQGYQHDGSTVTPAWTITSIDENSDWSTANDPCAIEMGSGWRIPTSTEWTNVDGASGGNWTNWNGPYSSALKLHAAGYLDPGDGSLFSLGSGGYYWSGTQDGSAIGRRLYFNSSYSYMSNSSKAFGFSARCLRD